MFNQLNPGPVTPPVLNPVSKPENFDVKRWKFNDENCLTMTRNLCQWFRFVDCHHAMLFHSLWWHYFVLVDCYFNNIWMTSVGVIQIDTMCKTNMLEENRFICSGWFRLGGRRNPVRWRAEFISVFQSELVSVFKRKILEACTWYTG
jgi:hypothetical protein